MTQWHDKGKRKRSGGMRTSKRRSDKLLAWRGGDPTETIVADKEKRKAKKGMGSSRKVRLRKARKATVSVPGQKKKEIAEIVAVAENKANRLYTRRNIVTKGALIKVKIGEKEHTARVTSRPGQNGIVQAVLEK